MGIIIIVVIAFILVFGIMGFLTYQQIKKTDPNNVDMSQKIAVATAQEFLPFEDIKDSMLHLGNHHYRAVIKCSSINYQLKTEAEQDIIEMSYQRFLNSLGHPISIFIQTKVMDNMKMMESLRKDIDISVEEFPALSEYGEAYLTGMKHLHEDIGNDKEKNKYIIVPYNDAGSLTNSSEEEKYQYAMKELYTRCQIIIDGLQGVGVRAELQNTEGLFKLIYGTYHKDNASQVDQIINKEFLSVLVDGQDAIAALSDEARLDWILYEAQLRLETELRNAGGVQQQVRQRTEQSIQEISRIRKTLAGYHQTPTSMMSK